MKIIVICILMLVILILCICLVKTLMLKPTPAISAKIDDAVNERALSYGQQLGEMIRCETISDYTDKDTSKFYKFHGILEGLFPAIHQTCEKKDFNGSLLFRWKGTKGKEPILLMSHMDVVEAGGDWEHDPFSGEIIDGKVWGRGTVDTKGNLFCIMQAVNELIKEGFKPEGDVYIASSATEEIIGEGALSIAEYLKRNGVKLRLLLDEGGVIMENPLGGLNGTYGMVGVLEKGYGDVKFIARSNGGHASAPSKKTPIARLSAFICEMERKSPFKAQINPTILEMFKCYAPNMVFPMKFIFANLWLFKPVLAKILVLVSPLSGAMVKTTLAFTMAKGSDGLNVLPEEAYVTGNMRFIHHQGTKESIRIVSDIAKKYDITTEIMKTFDPCPEVDYKGEAYKLVQKTANTIYPGVGITPYVMTGSTDCKFYSEVCDNAFRFAPLYISKQQQASIHGLNENIDAAALPKGVDYFKLLIKSL